MMFTVATKQRSENDAAAIWTGAEIEALNFAVAVGSHQGDLIPGTGGLRKLRYLAGDRFVAGVVLYDGESSLGFGDGIFAVPIRSLWEL